MRSLPSDIHGSSNTLRATDGVKGHGTALLPTWMLVLKGLQEHKPRADMDVGT